MTAPAPVHNGGTKPAPTSPTIRYQGTNISLGELLKKLEWMDDIAYSELRKINRDGVRSCMKTHREWLGKLLWVADELTAKIEELEGAVSNGD